MQKLLHFFIFLICITNILALCNKGSVKYGNQFSELWNSSQRLYVRLRPGMKIQCYDVLGTHKVVDGGVKKDRMTVECTDKKCSLHVYSNNIFPTSKAEKSTSVKILVLGIFANFCYFIYKKNK